MDQQFINSWKNRAVFDKQLALNLKQLGESPYPEHWEAFLKAFSLIKGPKTLVDVGCGCGTFSELLKRHYPNIDYIGYDYSSEAIALAKSIWNHGIFEVKNYLDLTPEDFKRGEILHACSLHNVMPDGDDCMDFLLNLKAKYLILGKILTTPGQSFFKTYTAYDEITTYMFFHSRDELFNKMHNSGYEITEINKTGHDVTNLFLKRNDV